MDAVVQRAGTSPPVPYRRWSDRDELVRAAIAHVLEQSRVDIPDTGSLREDVLTIMRTINATRVQLVTVMSVHLAGYYQETGTSPGDLLATGREKTADVLFDRAVGRGEIKPEHLSERISPSFSTCCATKSSRPSPPCPTASSKKSSTRPSSPSCADRDTCHKRPFDAVRIPAPRLNGGELFDGGDHLPP